MFQFASSKLKNVHLKQEHVFFLLCVNLFSKSMAEASNDVRYRVLESRCMAHTGEKPNLEQAVDKLTQILDDHVCIVKC